MEICGLVWSTAPNWTLVSKNVEILSILSNARLNLSLQVGPCIPCSKSPVSLVRVWQSQVVKDSTSPRTINPTSQWKNNYPQGTLPNPLAEKPHRIRKVSLKSCLELLRMLCWKIGLLVLVEMLHRSWKSSAIRGPVLSVCPELARNSRIKRMYSLSCVYIWQLVIN